MLRKFFRISSNSARCSAEIPFVLIPFLIMGVKFLDVKSFISKNSNTFKSSSGLSDMSLKQSAKNGICYFKTICNFVASVESTIVLNPSFLENPELGVFDAAFVRSTRSFIFLFLLRGGNLAIFLLEFAKTFSAFQVTAYF